MVRREGECRLTDSRRTDEHEEGGGAGIFGGYEGVNCLRKNVLATKEVARGWRSGFEWSETGGCASASEHHHNQGQSLHDKLSPLPQIVLPLVIFPCDCLRRTNVSEGFFLVRETTANAH